MSRRAHQPDTSADIELRECVSASPPRSFIMVAGAGSGKTTSLVKGLVSVLNVHGAQLKKRRQRVACITYTEIAASEIWEDVGNNPLVHVATIHSFLWSLVRNFQIDVQQWVGARLDEKLIAARTAGANFGPRVQQRTRDKNLKDIERYEAQRQRLALVKSFTYGTGSDYAKGILGHDDVLKMVPQLIVERPLLKRLVAQQYPFIFVDESQDTTENVVRALKDIDEALGEKFCVGFFGDPMQQIYATGIGAIPPLQNWVDIKKPENFRCPTKVLAVANAVRLEGDGLQQTRGRTAVQNGATVPIAGSAHIFVIAADAHRQERLEQVRSWAAKASGDDGWLVNKGENAPRMLVIVHRMAALRLGFGALYAAMNDKAPDAFKNGFLDASAWPLRPFMSFLLPLMKAKHDGEEFEVMRLLRENSPLLAKAALAGVSMPERLAKLGELVQRVSEMGQVGSVSSIGEVLSFAQSSGLCELDPRLVAYLNLGPAPEANSEPTEEEEEDDEELGRELASMDAFLACPVRELWGYRDYVIADSPFATQQGIKGAEFDRVLVVLDDEEGTHFQFSYEKYLGLKELSAKERENADRGEETTIDRTRRLFYVCCTRAMEQLVVVLFTSNVAQAVAAIRSRQYFEEDAVHTVADLT